MPASAAVSDDAFCSIVARLVGGAFGLKNVVQFAAMVFSSGVDSPPAAAAGEAGADAAGADDAGDADGVELELLHAATDAAIAQTAATASRRDLERRESMSEVPPM
jgi:hypothetical protein